MTSTDTYYKEFKAQIGSIENPTLKAQLWKAGWKAVSSKTSESDGDCASLKEMNGHKISVP